MVQFLWMDTGLVQDAQVAKHGGTPMRLPLTLSGIRPTIRTCLHQRRVFMLPVFRLLIALSCLAMMGIPSALAAQAATPAASAVATPIAGAAAHGSLLAA